MRLAALFSGGKDSTYAVWLAQKEGHEVQFLCTIYSKNMDSYMFDTSSIGLTIFQSEAMGIRLISKESTGEKEKELHDLEILLKDTGVEGVVVGALASNYQKKRVDDVCSKLGMQVLTPLWHVDEEQYLRKMVKEGFEVIFTKVQAAGLDKSWLGRKLDSKAIDDLLKLKAKHGIHIGGEGGEFDTKVLDCPMFNKYRIEITKSETKWDSKTESGELLIKDAKLVAK